MLARHVLVTLADALARLPTPLPHQWKSIHGPECSERRQFDPKDRKVKITKGKSANGEYILVDATGTYLKPDGPPMLGKTKPTPGSRVLNIMLMVEDQGSYFFKLAGPEKTVAGAATDLRTSFGAKADDEKEQKAN